MTRLFPGRNAGQLPLSLLSGFFAVMAAVVCSVLICTTAARSEEYVIGEGDTLQITVFGHPDLATTVRVSREGPIRFPLLGHVAATGLTVSQIAAAISDGLADGYIVDPQVSVSVQEYRMKKYNVLGKVNRPGQYEFRGRMTFLELLSRAGGLAPDAGSQAFVKRKSSSEVIKSGDLVIDLKALVVEGNIFRDVDIMDEDTVTVTEAGNYFLAGEVRRPAQYRFEEGMTFIRAITIAGGLTERAATDKLKVVRFEGEREQLLEVGMDAASLEGPVHRSDLIVVSAARTEVCYVTGEVKTAGSVPCDRTTTVFKAVTLAGGFTDSAAKGKMRIVRRVDGQSKSRDNVSLDEPLLPDDILVIPKSFF